jgi:hypothetical protein
MGLKASEEILDTPEYVSEHTLAGRKGIGRLRKRAVSVVEEVELRRFSPKEERLSR